MYQVEDWTQIHEVLKMSDPDKDWMLTRDALKMSDQDFEEARSLWEKEESLARAILFERKVTRARIEQERKREESES